ncbi:hypothetical protein ANCDUO_01720 [Ancylostoma duodenale]|uniref:ATP-dependent DNA helicase n=1 Tax=Ancylostoma duodenale TaxID=51022 RepID=A0A0C2HEH8_9BILA|nr:hypothetical protein ANCDUO_01720 [Ancylostoma duodenale]
MTTLTSFGKLEAPIENTAINQRNLQSWALEIKRSPRIMMVPIRFAVRIPGCDEPACRRQLPLKLAWAISIHKSQGLTLDAVDRQKPQKAMRNVPESGDAVVRLLTTLLKRSIDTMAGLGVLVRIPSNGFSSFALVFCFAYVDSLLRNLAANRADITAACRYRSCPMALRCTTAIYTTQFDLNHLLESWEVPSRARDDDHVTRIFLRRYLLP